MDSTNGDLRPYQELFGSSFFMKLKGQASIKTIFCALAVKER
ncbi:hypothetical protein [Peribacillus butanolivorans]|nr:hypothetical protein [Peribacillus butanolivorans]